MARPFLEWTDNLSVGIQEIDEQHKVLIRLINNLYEDAVVKQSPPDVTKETVKKLVLYAIVHFAVEESLFRIFGYPEAETHIRRHVHLKAQVLELQRKIKRGETMTDKDLRFLKGWLSDHILQEDQLYAPYLIKAGVKNLWGQKSWLGKVWNSD